MTYDLPGFGESDPDPKRDLESSAMDILNFAYAVNVTDKLWVLGYSEGSKHAFAAIHYIPDRIAGNSTASSKIILNSFVGYDYMIMCI